MRRTVVIVLLLASCGSAKASPAGDSTAATFLFNATATTETAQPSTTIVHSIVDAEAAFPARLSLTTKDGQIATLAPHTDPVITSAVSAPTGNVAVSAVAAGGATTIEWHDLTNDAVTASVQIGGEFRPTAVAQDGQLAALISSAPTSTTVVLATPSGGELRRWTFNSVVVPEAFADVALVDGLPIGVFVIEYLAANTYRVRVIDTATGQLGLPLNLRDKSQTVDEVMTAVSRTAVFDPARQLLFTLYQDASEGGENIGSFIHTLGLFNGVWCLDVPEQLGLADHPGALAVSPDGTRLYAASSTGGVAGYVVDDITSGEVTMPTARTTTQLDASAGRVAIGASADQVVVALGGRLFRLDPTTLDVTDSFTWDMDVEALTVLPDHSIVIVGTGRMTLVSRDDQIMAERVLPALTSEVTRVAVVG